MTVTQGIQNKKFCVSVCDCEQLQIFVGENERDVIVGSGAGCGVTWVLI